MFFENGHKGTELLEEEFDKRLLHTKDGSLTLGDIFVPVQDKKRRPELPYWVTNATIFQNSAHFAFTPNTLRHYQVVSYLHWGQSRVLSKGFSDPNYAAEFPVALAVAASASYPYAFPTVTLESTACDKACYLQLIDGGLSDNFGIYSMLEMLAQDQSPIKILVIVDAYSGHDQPFSKKDKPPSGVRLLWRVANMAVDSARQRMRLKVEKDAINVLCRHGTKNVLVAYLALPEDSPAREIGTGFYLKPEQQETLLRVGQDLVKNNPELQQDLRKILAGDLQISRCSGSV